MPLRLADLRSASRRDFFCDAFGGIGALALAELWQRTAPAAEGTRNSATDPLAPKPPHLTARAKSVIFLFMAGGPSHLETFDPKPVLTKLDGQRRPAEFGEAKYQFVKKDAKLLGSKRSFKKCGQSGIEVSDLFPEVGRCVDDLAVVRSCHADKVVHSAAQYQLFSGRVVPGFPSLGSWVLYGLGSDSDSLPSYVVMPDPHGALEAGQPMYANGFLPAVYQPTMLRSGEKPIRNLDLPAGVTLDQRRETLRLLENLNRASASLLDDEALARIRAYELVFKMQIAAPEVFDLGRETRETLDLYGVGGEKTDDYGRRCLLARRMVERGVRFITVVSGGGPGNLQWDAHGDIEENHLRMAAQVDRPIAGLLSDLKRRGLLESTLVLWGGEFGRSPEAQGGVGRDHHNLGFTMWLAGGGVPGGQVIGATDAIGLKAIDDPCHFRDLHATMLRLLGLDQDELTWLHLGRRERLTELQGRVIPQLVPA
ncbi:MAG: DUF1501 domain-containing protein [Planctomycetia bacterium]|nr:DUF1501 domain-containing protein [Planctomycetia bacterium]